MRDRTTEELLKDVGEAMTHYKLYDGDCELCIGMNEQTQKHRKLIAELSTKLREKDKALIAVDDVLKDSTRRKITDRNDPSFGFNCGYNAALGEIRKAIESTGE